MPRGSISDNLPPRLSHRGHYGSDLGRWWNDVEVQCAKLATFDSVASTSRGVSHPTLDDLRLQSAASFPPRQLPAPGNAVDSHPFALGNGRPGRLCGSQAAEADGRGGTGRDEARRVHVAFSRVLLLIDGRTRSWHPAYSTSCFSVSRCCRARFHFSMPRVFKPVHAVEREQTAKTRVP